MKSLFIFLRGELCRNQSHDASLKLALALIKG